MGCESFESEMCLLAGTSTFLNSEMSGDEGRQSPGGRRARISGKEALRRETLFGIDVVWRGTFGGVDEESGKIHVVS